ncbi:MAG: T9SS type A sorting domain-containing protein [Flavobacteriales bacterium]|nr:T9SS type A sorting domain-containing protein [Flavobacteriales bacterium]
MASNIHVKDTLDNNLDLNTLNVIQTSHYCLPTVNANTREVDFFFPNIALADSASNEPESHGFIHYRISPVENIQEMTKVNNNADIYFDFNPAIITNTTWTTFSDLFFSVKETQQTFTPIIYPNPASDLVTIQFPADFNSGDISILDLQGRRVAHLQNITGSIITYSLSNLSAGNYVIKTHSNDKIIFHPIKLCVVK